MQKIRLFLLIFVILSIVLAMTSLVCAESAPDTLSYAISTAGIRPTLTLAANTPKTDSMPGLAGFKCDDGQPGFDTSAAGVFTFNPVGTGSLTVWLAVDPAGAVYIDRWESTGLQIRLVMVKGGNGYLTYDYSSPVTADGHLYPPMTGKDSKNVAGISHITFFYVADAVTENLDETTETTGQTGSSQPSGDSVTDATTAAPIWKTSSDSTTETTVASLTGQDVPLASNSTESPAETTCETTVTLTGTAIPRTGEAAPGTGLVIGLLLLVMAVGLSLVIMRNPKVQH